MSWRVAGVRGTPLFVSAATERGPTVRHVFPVALAMLCVGAAFAGSASAAAPTACSLLTAADYKQVLGKPVRMTAGEGTASCNVFIGANPFSAKVWIIPGLGRYDAG